ncbi:hypothetical protein D8B34_17360 [Verminephrobacter eiseniae]|nr:hypothetical protein [Verminephrobacter eiseniae]MCW8185663.1 hypothetical protein [Verminephrobacter eiseniae]MCW8225192.1 hypothetical protein [Verminephrobacter eiseniae]MCW8235462.1 hypothetical protein [Verminephrobacter eiseniae]
MCACCVEPAAQALGMVAQRPLPDARRQGFCQSGGTAPSPGWSLTLWNIPRSNTVASIGHRLRPALRSICRQPGAARCRVTQAGIGAGRMAAFMHKKPLLARLHQILREQRVMGGRPRSAG